MEKKPLTGLWRDNPDTPEGKYLVKRRDGTVVEWPNFVIGAKDPAAPAALRAYADSAESHGMNAGYVSGVRRLADDFENYRLSYGEGDPDRGRLPGHIWPAWRKCMWWSWHLQIWNPNQSSLYTFMQVIRQRLEYVK